MEDGNQSDTGEIFEFASEEEKSRSEDSKSTAAKPLHGKSRHQSDPDCCHPNTDGVSSSNHEANSANVSSQIKPNILVSSSSDISRIADLKCDLPFTAVVSHFFN